MSKSFFAVLGASALLGVCILSACGNEGGEVSGVVDEALGPQSAPQLQLQVRTNLCTDRGVEDAFEITNTGTTPVPLSSISVKLWVDDTGGHPIVPLVLDPGRVTGDPACDREARGVHAAATPLPAACGPDARHQANWEVTVSDTDSASLAPGAAWRGIGLGIGVEGLRQFSPGTSDWYSACQGASYQHTSSYAVYVGGQLVTSSTGVPPSCRAPHGSQQLSGHVPGGQGNVPIVGPVPPSTPVILTLALPLTHQADLQTFIQQVYDPASPKFRQFLKPAAFGAAYGATQADYGALTTFIASKGLTVTTTHSSRALLTVSGTAAQVESAFYVTLDVYRNPDGTTYQAPANEPSLDLGVPLLHIGGLDNATEAKPADRNGGTGPFMCNPTQSAGGAVESYVGTDMARVYLPCNAASATPLDGTGQTVALFEESGAYPNDYLDYVNPSFGGFPGLDTTPDVTVEVVTTPNANQVYLPPLSGDCSGAPAQTAPTANGPEPLPPSNCQNSGSLTTSNTAVYMNNLKFADEVAIDVEMVLAIAPKAHVILYEQEREYSGPGGLGGNFYPEQIFGQMAEEDVAQTISVSWYWNSHAGYDPVLAQLFQQFAAQGQSLFVAAGDLGSYLPGGPLPDVAEPIIDSAFITTVGGTQLTTTGSGATLAYGSETTWNDAGDRLASHGCVDTPPYLNAQGQNAACNSVAAGGLAAGYTLTNQDGTTARYPDMPLPAYQSHLPQAYGGAAIPANAQLSTALRMIPDVSMLADSFTVFWREIHTTNGGANYTVYDPIIVPCAIGTSASSPLWAGLVSLMNQQLADAHQPGPIGFANPTLYALAGASGASYASNFHDVADGSNNAYDLAATPNAYTSQPGYDLTTGLGTPSCGLLQQPVCVTCGGPSCVILDKDPGNCGACGHACGNDGTSCVGGQCVPLAPVVGVSYGLATDGVSVYWTDQGTSSSTGLVASVPVGGGAVVTLHSGANVPEELALDSSTVFWTGGSGVAPEVSVLAVPKGGGSMSIIFPGDVFSGLAVDATDIYVGGFDGGMFQASNAGPSPPVELSTTLDPVRAVVLSGGRAYWESNLTQGSGSILSAPIGGGAVTTLASGLDFSGYGGPAAYALATDGASLYWIEENASGSGRIASVSLSGGAVTTLTTVSGTFPGALAVDGSKVYWTSAAGGTAVSAVPKAGGAVAPLASGTAGTTIAVDATSVYWTVSGNGQQPASGGVYKIAK